MTMNVFAIVAIAPLSLLACVGGDEVHLGPDPPSPQVFECNLTPGADMCGLQVSKQQLQLVESVSEYWGDSRNLQTRISGTCARLASAMGVSNVPVGSTPMERAQEACLAVEQVIATTGPYIRNDANKVSCNPEFRTTCNEAIFLAMRLHCVPAEPVSFTATTESDEPIALALADGVAEFTSIRADLESIDALVAPDTFPTQADDLPQPCEHAGSIAIGESTYIRTISHQIVDGFMSAASGHNGPPR
jgi:hypothetical protein